MRENIFKKEKAKEKNWKKWKGKDENGLKKAKNQNENFH